MWRYVVAAIVLLWPAAATAAPVKDLKITVLSTMLADARGVGEWGYAALVETGGRRILFDTGARPETVLTNARELGIDLAGVEEVVISHNHGDHTGGLVTLRRELMKANPKALSRVHVAEGIFLPRTTAAGGPGNGLLRERAAYEALGGRFVVHARPVELAPGVWLTGPVPRPHPERNYPATARLSVAAGPAADTIPEDASLVVDTPEGLVVLTGCGHAGIVNTATYGREIVRAAPLLAVVGGLHLFNASQATLDWTGAKLREYGVKHLLAGHCTGLEATWQLRRATGLDSRTAAYGAVGASFVLGKGIDPRPIAR